jgi:hypothetical protein
MDWIEIITLAVMLGLFAFAAIYAMRVPEPKQAGNVSSYITPDGHHVYSVNVSDSLGYKDR